MKPNGTKLPPPPPPTKANGTKPTETLALSRATPKFVAPRIILNAVEGYGKTSAGAYAPNAALLMARGETGYETLLANGLVPEIDTAVVSDWQQLLDFLHGFKSEHQTLVLDALGGFERMCHEHVCNREYGGDWGEKGFTAYQKGYDVSVSDWLKLLSALDRIHNNGVTILLLSHCKIKTVKNPMGADYDRYVADVHDKTWAVTAKWADAVLFGNFHTVVETQKNKQVEALRKGKGIGGTERVLYTQHHDAFDAKNRYGMPERIDIPNDYAKVWDTIWRNLNVK